ncbi:MAG: DUF892 family protein, partial [Bacteroidia bacterium]
MGKAFFINDCGWHEIYSQRFIKHSSIKNKKMNTNTKSNSTSQKKEQAEKKSKQAGKGANDSMLQDFFVDELKDIYWAEKHLVKTLPKMQKAATS